MIEAPDLDTLMAGSLGQWLEKQAGVRDVARALSNKRFMISAVVLLPILGILWLAVPMSEVFKGWISMISLFGASWWGYSPRAKAIKETKTGINSAIAEALGISYSHDCMASAGFERAKALKMFASYDRSSLEDLWYGDLGGNPFTLQEAHLEDKRGSGKDSHYVTIFRGPVITIGFTRSFHGTTLVERAGRHKKFGFFGEKDELDLAGLKLDKVDMVHPVFEDAFTVYSTDQVEARYLVHPTYIERLIALETSFSGKNIRTLFRDGEVTILLTADNMFESGSMNASRDRELVQKCITQFMAMARVAEALNEVRR